MPLRLLLEKNRRPGVKILMSGGTRCNLTNARGLRDLGVVSGPIDPAYDPGEARGVDVREQQRPARRAHRSVSSRRSTAASSRFSW